MKLEKISERIFFSTIKINLETTAGHSIVGTGFLVSKFLKKNESIVFLVASKELVYNATVATLVFHEAEDENVSGLKEKENIHIRIGEQDWKNMWFSSSHSDSFVIAPIMPVINFIEKQLGKLCYFQPIDITSTKESQLTDISLSEDILFLTYLDENIIENESMPVLGRAKLASALSRKINDTPVFLINAPDTSSCAGSPVFILNEGSFMTKNGPVLGNRFLFLGIMSGAITHGLGEVVKASLLNRVIDEFLENIKGF